MCGLTHNVLLVSDVQHSDFIYIYGFPGDLVVKNLPANAGDRGSISRSGRSPKEGNGKPLQYSFLGNPMETRACQAIVHGVVKESDMT